MTDNEKERIFLYIISTQYQGNLVGKTLKWRNRWREGEISAGRQAPPNVTLTWKSLRDVKPGEQDIVLAGGRNDDEEHILRMRGSGQIIVRYSQLDFRQPYSGRSVEELGYSFLASTGMGNQPISDIRKLLYSYEFLEGLENRDPVKMVNGLSYSGIYPTGYLAECCKIQVQSTPKNLIAEAVANEEKAIAESERQYYRSSGSGGNIVDFLKSRY